MPACSPRSRESVESGTPLVSVGIPTFNRPEGLRRTLEYITGQTYKNIEIIVSDNASTDPMVRNILNEFSALDKRIRFFIQEKNIGAIANFQFVFEQASGEYFMWASDDDSWHESFIAELVSGLQKATGAIVAFCDFQIVLEDGSPAPGFPRQRLKYLLPFSNTNKTMRCARYFFQDGSKGKAYLIYGLFRRCMLDDTNLITFSEKYGDYAFDVLFLFTLLQRGRAVIVEKMLYKTITGNKKHHFGIQYNKNSPRFKITKLFRFCKHSSGILLICILALIPVQLIYDNLPLEKFFKQLNKKDWNI